MYQYTMGRDLYKYLFESATHKSKMIPMPNERRIREFRQKGEFETFECKEKCCVANVRVLFSQEQFNRHMAMHQSYICIHCGKGLKDTGHMKKHLLNNHFPKQHRCKLCDKEFCEPDTLEVHIAVTHLKRFPSGKAYKADRK